MAHRRPRRARPITSVVTALLVALVSVIIPGLGTPTAAAAPADVQPRTAAEPTADPLPTVQVNGVVWTQLVVGDTVYVGGSFSSARPAGAAAGVEEVPRTNLLAYDLATGVLKPDFAPVLNQQVNALAASPDGTRIYVGGQFTTVNGLGRYRLAAFDSVTGQLLTSFQPKVDYIVSALAVSGGVVYAGGSFSSANGSVRDKLAAFASTNGALLNWAPSVDNAVKSMVLSPDGSRLVIAGMFTTLNGAVARGSAAIDTVSGASLPWAANSTIVNGGTSSAILSLSSDGTSVYGGGYKFGGAGNLEGVFKADMNTGEVQWIEDCHGDTYGVWVSPTAVYQVGHAHYCGNNMGWAQPAVWDYNRTLAFTKEATGTLIHEPLGYTNYAGRPAPSIKSWFPNLTVGTYTGKGQAAWSVTGTSDYVLLGGEFTEVNGVPQQGLVRFATTARSAAKSGPMVTGAQFKPVLTAAGTGAVRVSWRANWDRDDQSLTYRVYRNGSQVREIRAASTEWNRPALGFTDTGLTPGAMQNYRIEAVDGEGNTVRGDGVSMSAPSDPLPLGDYGRTVLDQGANLYWPMNDTGTTAVDRAGVNDGLASAGVTTGAGGALGTDSAMTFSGATGGSMASAGELVSPDRYSVVAWFRTTSIRGGRIIGFSDLATGSSGHRDRQVYMGNTGKLNYAVWGGNGIGTGGAVSFQSAAAYNDGQWHQVVATLGSSGMTMFVDGMKVGQRADVSVAERYVGHWRIGGDNSSGFANTPTSGYLAGSIDEVAVFPTALGQAQVSSLYSASGRTSPAPADAYGAAVFNDEPALYYRLGETGLTTVATDSAAGLLPGSYQGLWTRGVAGAVPGPNSAVRFNGSNGFVSSNTAFVNPTTYTVEAWFTTTTTSGGGIVGFGNTRTGSATSADRMIFLQNDGRLVFGSSSAAHTITSGAPVNDGRWHHVVASQGPGGMNLYIDGAAVGHLPWTTPAVLNGYWRVASTPTWGLSSSAFLSGTVDEVAIYPVELNLQQVRTHYGIGGGVLPNLSPTASFTTAVKKQQVTVDASGSTDPDGVVTGVSWDFGDGTTASGTTAVHAYTTAGEHLIRSTVVDDRGATATSTRTVTTVANVAPEAAFSVGMAGLSLTADATSSVDVDGSIATYTWDFGDGTSASGATASHRYATGGSRDVTLTVVDDDGDTDTTVQTVTAVAPPNAAPTAAFSTTVDRLVVSVVSSSTDADGSLVEQRWDFGGLGAAVGAAATFSFPGPGTYPVTLTVTDDDGAVSTSTLPVTVVREAVYASDSFQRTLPKGWGSADQGGPWTVSSTTGFAVTTGSGATMTLPTPGSQRSANLSGVSQTDVDLRVALSLDKAPAGGATQFSTSVRKVGTTEYRTTVTFNANGTVTLSLVRLISGTATTLRAVVVSGLTYQPGTILNVRFRASGAASTDLGAKVWPEGAPEPASFTATSTDSTPALQAAGAVALTGYLSGSASNAPVGITVTRLSVSSVN